MFIVLAALWGSSYLFIKIALEEGLEPGFIVFARTALAAAVLLPFTASASALRAVRRRIRPLIVLSVLQVTAPFVLITLGEQTLSSSLTGCLVAAGPIFTVVLAFVLDEEDQPGPDGLVGVAIAVIGVSLLLQVEATDVSAALRGGTLVVLATGAYAAGLWYFKRRVPDVHPTSAAATTCAVSAVMTLPFVLASPPAGGPSLAALGSLALLGVGGTGIAFVLFYALVATLGPSRTSLVGYAAPVFSVLYGVVLLDESFGATAASGLFLIVGGSWLAARTPAVEVSA